MKKPIIIEFFGIPGSGKTTITNELINKFKGLNYTAMDANKFANNRQRFKFLSIIKMFVLNLGICFKIFFRHGFNKFIFQQLYYMENLKKLLKNINNFDYIVIDQGFIQALGSIYNEKKVVKNNLFNNYIDHIIETYDIYFVKINLPIESGRKRVNERPENIVEFESMISSNTFASFLILSQKNLDIIEKTFLKNKFILSIDGTKRTRYNVDLIIKHLNVLTKS